MNEELIHTDLDILLDECVEQLRDGRLTVEECLANYPHHAVELEPLLRTAATFWATNTSSFDPLGMQIVEKRLLQRARQLRSEREDVDRRTHGLSWFAVRVVLATVALLVVVGVTGGVFVASANSLPGETFYPVKRLTENLQLVLARDDLQQARLRAEFAGRRWDEAVRQYEYTQTWNEAILQQMVQQLQSAANLLGHDEVTARKYEWTRIAAISQDAERQLSEAGFESLGDRLVLQSLHQLNNQAGRALGRPEQIQPVVPATMTTEIQPTQTESGSTRRATPAATGGRPAGVREQATSPGRSDALPEQSSDTQRQGATPADNSSGPATKPAGNQGDGATPRTPKPTQVKAPPPSPSVAAQRPQATSSPTPAVVEETMAPGETAGAAEQTPTPHADAGQHVDNGQGAQLETSPAADAGGSGGQGGSGGSSDGGSSGGSGGGSSGGGKH